VPERTAIREQRQHGHARLRARRHAEPLGQGGIHPGPEVRSVLLGRADGQDHRVHPGGRPPANLLPG
jgi:hypothetical protein